MDKLTLCAALCAAALPAQIYAPPDNSQHDGKVRIIAQTEGKGDLKLDGKAIQTESPHPGVATAELTLDKGIHTLELGDQRVRFAIQPADGFTPFRPHPPVAQCTSCHAVRNNRWRFTRASLSNVCSACHSKDTFPAKHTHGMDLLPDCQMCHNPHGSTAAGHMKLSREKACQQCHSLAK